MNTETGLSEKLNSMHPSDNPRETAQNALREICLFTTWPYGEAWKFNETNNQMRFLTAWYKDASFNDYEKFSTICKFSPGIGLIGKTLLKKEPVWIENLLEDLSFIRSDAARESGIISGFAVPLFKEEVLTGIYAFFMTRKRHNDELNKEIVVKVLSNFSF